MRLSYRGWSIITVAALAFAYSWLVQPSGDNQNAHYGLTRALAHGHATIDEIRGNGPERLPTGDVVEFEGHLYAAKAPGLAFASVPAFVVGDAAGLRTTGDPYRFQWWLHLWTSVLPALVMLVLVLRLGDRVAPGYGVAAAGALGLATLVEPFATLYFAHALSACLGFAAFWLLWLEREGSTRLPALAAAGLLCGLAFTVEYPLGLVAVALGAYALVGRRGLARRGFAYGAGLAAGVAPAFIYNWWAFGSPGHFPYEDWQPPGGEPYPGVFGVNLPRLDVALELLFVPAGVAAVFAPALVGIVVMHRRGFRAEAVLIAAVAGLYLLYNASSVDPFGGASPGPRYLIPMLPFVAVPLAPALQTVPGITLGTTVGAAAVLALYSVTTPLAAWDGHAWERLRAGSFVPTVAEPAGLTGAVAVAPFALALVLAAGAALAASGLWRLGRRDLLLAAAALGGWALVVWQTPRLVRDGLGGELALIGLVLAVCGVLAALQLARPSGRPALGKTVG